MRSTKSTRKAIVKLLDRMALERVTAIKQPWLVSRESIEHEVISRWPSNEIETEIAGLLRRARGATESAEIVGVE